ncbi:MAG: lysylphosphatidylglycerol synthase domain-containing protein [Gaiellaceae bacterium]
MSVAPFRGGNAWARPVSGVSLSKLWANTRRLTGDRRFRILAGAASAVFAGLLFTAAIRHFAATGWPLDGGNPLLIASAALLFLAAFAFKAYGWGRLFRARERPTPLSLAAAGGGASIMGVALPGRFDEAARVIIVRRYPGCPAGVPAIFFSLFTLGLIDNIALAPLAAMSASLPGLSFGVRVGFSVVAAGGIAAAILVLTLPRITRRKRLIRFRLVRWLRPRAPCARDACHAWGLISASWLIRAAALFLLLHTFGIATSIPLAIMFLCAGAASAAIPIGPAGAATQVTAGAALLMVSGVPAATAVAFALAAQALFVLAGGTVFLTAVAWRTGIGVRTALALR